MTNDAPVASSLVLLLLVSSSTVVQVVQGFERCSDLQVLDGTCVNACRCPCFTGWEMGVWTGPDSEHTDFTVSSMCMDPILAYDRVLKKKASCITPCPPDDVLEKKTNALTSDVTEVTDVITESFKDVVSHAMQEEEAKGISVYDSGSSSASKEEEEEDDAMEERKNDAGEEGDREFVSQYLSAMNKTNPNSNSSGLSGGGAVGGEGSKKSIGDMQMTLGKNNTMEFRKNPPIPERGFISQYLLALNKTNSNSNSTSGTGGAIGGEGSKKSIGNMQMTLGENNTIYFRKNPPSPESEEEHEGEEDSDEELQTGSPTAAYNTPIPTVLSTTESPTVEESTYLMPDTGSPSGTTNSSSSDDSLLSIFDGVAEFFTGTSSPTESPTATVSTSTPTNFPLTGSPTEVVTASPTVVPIITESPTALTASPTDSPITESPTAALTALPPTTDPFTELPTVIAESVALAESDAPFTLEPTAMATDGLGLPPPIAYCTEEEVKAGTCPDACKCSCARQRNQPAGVWVDTLFWEGSTEGPERFCMGPYHAYGMVARHEMKCVECPDNETAKPKAKGEEGKEDNKRRRWLRSMSS